MHRARDGAFLDIKHTPSKLVLAATIYAVLALMSNAKLSKIRFGRIKQSFEVRASETLAAE